ncbi:hypothetical protein ABB37_07945 [Leptomonas pyrrhocoris]|uniref:Uncharacterized protein n=1 Tax=Leptomonas pyrrhocoris TaxID=157538 RepID=A0A0M9FUG1_LEPPY|nr:hypothetical protein ABB37_07945 [Leptomonas pyrrhocoris]XP_015654627.1 hypothetical protein ABB37_07945 [Leptomonas pyrrhocoris]KPA76187.1 hypothetical protein ABB37_07945 [Leptomonas pyrrhocoris]KPA76188.1 hypothetical protein ABB37_07945 [Leptomonas pyrrhocoris]|eukprot:XP_015654626.1 hypothetical protein ABB37_07945 [Leptomonas pyrrhocoris]
MSKLHFKGGPWTNAEDQVLKAALAQYGLRDWERVASMLTKKTSTQCRERWENYLDPRLNIREAWSLEEEEKLVELQSLFPSKFRLISEQLTRRTSTHYIRPAWLCEQRYLELKDEQEHYVKQQQQKGTGESDEAARQSLEAFMAERRRRRNARKTHEERAARADTVSGERFQQEMVDMATSRLANQDQKKGLRKERQRQLEEAAFLAKLESNREGIESGTLSLRQSKKMRKALEEDRQSTGLVDTVAEDGEGEGGNGGDADDESDGVGRAASGDDSDKSDFEAMDMYQDQQQAGLVKKQRVLMKDLAGQQRVIQQRQILGGGEDAQEGGEGSSESRARAALTGVNHDLLAQLTAGPSRKAVNTATTSAAALLPDLPSSSHIRKAEADGELKNSLADLFASLPQATATASGIGSTGSGMLPPPPPLKRQRDPLSSGTGDAADDDASSGDAPRVLSRNAPSSSVSESILDSLNLPAPRKYVKTEEDRRAAPPTSSPAPAVDAPSPVCDDVDSSSHPLRTFRTAEEESAYVTVARQWVAVECERAATTTKYTRRVGDAGGAALARSTSAAERDAAEKLVAREIAGGGPIAAEDEGGAVQAVKAYVNDHPRYTARVNVQNALHQLSTRVAAQVQEANAVLQPLRQEWEQVLSAAMLDPRQLHVLQGYVRDDGRLKQPAAFVEDNETGDAHPTLSVAAYVYEHLVNELTRARQATRFLSSLRDREQLKMRRDLDAAEDELRQLQAREKILQDMYRQKRAQQ